MGYKHGMLEAILAELRHELLTRAPLDALPPRVWRRTGALNTWGTNAIEGNTLSRKDVERILLEGRSVANRPLPDVLETIQHEQAFESLLERRADPIGLSAVLDLHATVFRGIKPDAGPSGDLTALEALLTTAMGRSLLDLLDQVGTAEDALKPLRKIATRGPYSAKYLGLRAGQEKLPAIKIAGDWNTSPRALRLYRERIDRS